MYLCHFNSLVLLVGETNESDGTSLVSITLALKVLAVTIVTILTPATRLLVWYAD